MLQPFPCLLVAHLPTLQPTFWQANRDLLDYRFLYMLTSEKLRAENTNDNATSEVLDAEVLC